MNARACIIALAVVTVAVAACSSGGAGSIEALDPSDGGIHEGGVADAGPADATGLPCNSTPPADGCAGACPGDARRAYVCSSGTWTCPPNPPAHCPAPPDAGCSGGPPPGSCHDSCGGNDQGYVCEGGHWTCKAAQIPCDAGAADAALD